ncbi:MAG: hypothetical protein ACRBM6_04970 [Geminicoccales bacterium]
MSEEDGFQARDFVGYGSDPPGPGWPGGARVAVSVVINVEEGSEHSIRRGDAINDNIDGVRGIFRAI